MILTVLSIELDLNSVNVHGVNVSEHLLTKTIYTSIAYRGLRRIKMSNTKNNGHDIDTILKRIMTDKHTILSHKNDKMITSSIDGRYFLSWSITPVDTCPGADKCKSGCFGLTGHYATPSVKMNLADNYTLSQSDLFVDIMTNEIRRYMYVKNLFIRVHAVGDFYDMDYLKKWVAIANNNPSVTFYAYTKSVMLFKEYGQLPDNMIVIYSYGGKYDNLINPDKDKIAVVFPTLESIPSGYVDCGDDDYNAIINQKTALVYHSNKKYENTNWSKVLVPQ